MLLAAWVRAGARGLESGPVQCHAMAYGPERDLHWVELPRNPMAAGLRWTPSAAVHWWLVRRDARWQRWQDYRVSWLIEGVTAPETRPRSQPCEAPH